MEGKLFLPFAHVGHYLSSLSVEYSRWHELIEDGGHNNCCSAHGQAVCSDELVSVKKPFVLNTSILGFVFFGNFM